MGPPKRSLRMVGAAETLTQSPPSVSGRELTPQAGTADRSWGKGAGQSSRPRQGRGHRPQESRPLRTDRALFRQKRRRWRTLQVPHEESGILFLQESREDDLEGQELERVSGRQKTEAKREQNEEGLGEEKGGCGGPAAVALPPNWRQRALLLQFPAAPWMRPLVFSVRLQTYTPPQPRVSGRHEDEFLECFQANGVQTTDHVRTAEPLHSLTDGSHFRERVLHVLTATC
ncbi:unnamed protein product [Rangifer tarandus platyrhynchus]|uniref:Uncharacterized protein n=2 Tax=Rangifer tarandus platyrhynchus TaxID=3082113 RepID=A0ACB0F566_RANTA|nr:unnamed protein product [Rangifer tarandus platyrhynchus]CAI9708218.1 unnamed protein product [Rangifer tarandus platyrhynchus]